MVATKSAEKRLYEFPALAQPDAISCGPTCAAMVLQWYGIDAGIQRCKTKCNTRWFSWGGYKVGMTKPSGIYDCLQSYRLPARVFTVDIDDISRLIDARRPPILLVRSGVEYWHWVVAVGYKGSQILLCDPAGASKWYIQRSILNSAMMFSTDLEGHATGGRRCATCGGGGKLVSAKSKCWQCVGTGKMLSGGIFRKCSKCGGDGKIDVSGGKCLVCGGSGSSPDFYRKVVESAGVAGHTAIIPMNGCPVVEYSIGNRSGAKVSYKMWPSGKSYELEAKKRFKGSSCVVNGKPPQVKILSTGKEYSLTKGYHEFFRLKDGKIGFDRDAQG